MSRHQQIIVGGLGCITLALGVLMAVDKSPAPTASLGQVIAQVTATSSPGPNSGRSTPSAKKKVGDTSPTSTMSPILSPIIGDMSPIPPSLVPTASVSPSTSTQEYKQITPTPSPVAPSPSVVPTVSPVNPTPSLLASPSSTPASVVPVVFSEIGWMGTAASSADEWIELYNPNSVAVSLEGWIVKSETDGSPTISLAGTIGPRGVYILERTDDTPLQEIVANWKGSFGAGGLKNEGERLVLFNAQGVVQDSVGPGVWYAGDAVTKASMERNNPGTSGDDPQNWHTATQDSSIHDADGNAIRGTPGHF
jgi:hypothetical protein